MFSMELPIHPAIKKGQKTSFRIVFGGVALLVWLNSCKVTAIGEYRLRVEAQAEDARGKPLSGVQLSGYPF